MRRDGAVRSVVLATAVSLGLAACAPLPIATGDPGRPAALTGVIFETPDGFSLPYRHWPTAEPGAERAIVVALHGFNDYSQFFDAPAKYFAKRGISSYAYDQRGFGAATLRGRWFETRKYAEDAGDFIRLIARRHPGKPVYLLGDSMGGAVAMLTLSSPDAPIVAGAILAAPAVWGRAAMPWYQRWSLWIAAHTIPSVPLTSRGLDITPSDNIEMLRALGRDPLIIKGARVDTIYGLVDLMDQALAASTAFNRSALILYGGRDDIVPKEPIRQMLRALPPASAEHRRVAVYKDSYHMLLRDLAAESIWNDIAEWIAAPSRPLPSGAEKATSTFLDNHAP